MEAYVMAIYNVPIANIMRHLLTWTLLLERRVVIRKLKIIRMIRRILAKWKIVAVGGVEDVQVVVAVGADAAPDVDVVVKKFFVKKKKMQTKKKNAQLIMNNLKLCILMCLVSLCKIVYGVSISMYILRKLW